MPELGKSSKPAYSFVMKEDNETRFNVYAEEFILLCPTISGILIGRDYELIVLRHMLAHLNVEVTYIR